MGGSLSNQIPDFINNRHIWAFHGIYINKNQIFHLLWAKTCAKSEKFHTDFRGGEGQYLNLEAQINTIKICPGPGGT